MFHCVFLIFKNLLSKPEQDVIDKIYATYFDLAFQKKQIA